MTFVIIGKLKNFDLNENSAVIETPEGKEFGNLEEIKLTKRAMWDYCYKYLGKKKTIKMAKEQGIVKTFLETFEKTKDAQRDMQFISNGKSIIAITTTKHDITKQDIYEEIFSEIIKNYFGKNAKHEFGFAGKIAFLEETGLAKIGVQFYGGDITTFKAIRITNGILIKACLNPLSFLRATILSIKEIFEFNPESIIRIKRYEAKTEVYRRIEAGVEHATKNMAKIEEIYEKNVSKKITEKQLKTLLAGLGYHLSVSKNILAETALRYKKYEIKQHGNTIWALAMAASWVARRSNLFRKDERRQNLSTLAGAVTLISDIKLAEELIRKRNKDNPVFKENIKAINEVFR